MTAIWPLPPVKVADLPFHAIETSSLSRPPFAGDSEMRSVQIGAQPSELAALPSL